MRHNLLKPAALMLIGSLCSIPAFAQSNKSTKQEKSVTKDETVVIKQDKGDDKTVIEIKDGSIYVNGEAVVTVRDADAANIHKKIIIENGGSSRGKRPHVEAFSFGGVDENFRDMPAPPNPRRAMLGVM